MKIRDFQDTGKTKFSGELGNLMKIKNFQEIPKNKVFRESLEDFLFPRNSKEFLRMPKILWIFEHAENALHFRAWQDSASLASIIAEQIES